DLRSDRDRYSGTGSHAVASEQIPSNEQRRLGDRRHPHRRSVVHGSAGQPCAWRIESEQRHSQRGVGERLFPTEHPERPKRRPRFCRPHGVSEHVGTLVAQRHEGHSQRLVERSDVSQVRAWRQCRRTFRSDSLRRGRRRRHGSSATDVPNDPRSAPARGAWITAGAHRDGWPCPPRPSSIRSSIVDQTSSMPVSVMTFVHPTIVSSPLESRSTGVWSGFGTERRQRGQRLPESYYRAPIAWAPCSSGDGRKPAWVATERRLDQTGETEQCNDARCGARR
ncbi:MAG: hypothetical protein QOD30_1900, partial [Actinomycetota bacterium]|nr:hypothetical protein [Actinomycetota bacterium]